MVARLAPFTVLLRDCLQMHAQEELLAVFDESAQNLIPDLVDAVNKLGVQATLLYLPQAYQRRLMRDKRRNGDKHPYLPRRFTDAFRDARTILLLLGGDLSTTSIRTTVLDIERKEDCRCAHIPGFTREMLNLLPASPLREIQRTGEMMSWALGEAQQAELVTYDKAGQPHTLSLQLDGWRCGPFLSSGVISSGSWGNVPPGESFCCPESYEKVEGEVCVNGSVPDRPLAKGEEVVLRFVGGKLVSWRPKDSPAAIFLETEKRVARRRKDENWNTFAELGIGLNPAVTALTGNSLVDEKAAGTVHIAIGGNRTFGGPVSSYIHADMVTWGATLSLDGHEVITKGTLNLRTIARWRRRLTIPPLDAPPDSWVGIDEAKWEISTGQLRLKRNNRLDYIRMADKRAWQRFEVVRGHLPQELDSFPLGTFYARLESDRALLHTARDLLGLLHHYDVLHVKQ